MCNHKTLYLAKEMADFVTIADLIKTIENTKSLSNVSVDIVCLFTGELYACRLANGLWEIFA